MTGLEKIVEQILEEANTQSDMILEDAQKKADQIIEDAKVEADKIKAGSAEKVSHVKADTRPTNAIGRHAARISNPVAVESSAGAPFKIPIFDKAMNPTSSP